MSKWSFYNQIFEKVQNILFEVEGGLRFQRSTRLYPFFGCWHLRLLSEGICQSVSTRGQRLDYSESRYGMVGSVFSLHEMTLRDVFPL